MSPFSPRSVALVAALLIVLVTRVFACEGDCKVGITAAFVGNYSGPVNLLFEQLAEGLRSQLLVSNSAPPRSCLSPISEEYQARAYAAMQDSIFSTLFHGKCQDPTTGIDPPGCPNPDCPVICGTPGSMVHAYPLLRIRAFNSTVHLLEAIAKPDTAAYQKVRQCVEANSSPPPSRQTRMFRSERFDWTKREDVSDAALRGLLREIRSMLVQACGGSTSGRLNGLPNCSWEAAFKKYILTFP